MEKKWGKIGEIGQNSNNNNKKRQNWNWKKLKTYLNRIAEKNGQNWKNGHDKTKLKEKNKYVP